MDPGPDPEEQQRHEGQHQAEVGHPTNAGGAVDEQIGLVPATVLLLAHWLHHPHLDQV